MPDRMMTSPFTDDVCDRERSTEGRDANIFQAVILKTARDRDSVTTGHL